MDLSKIRISTAKASRDIDPVIIFDSLTLRGSVENIWAPQAEALRAWHVERSVQDVVVELNTGGGKTLVGLLIAQSLVNETAGSVLYLCPNNQLVEQTVERAAECGMEVATYRGGEWQRRDVYDGAKGFCVTNYAAAFNGRSIFRDDDVRGIVFDDAHVAGDAIRGQYTVRIPADHAAYQPAANLFRSYFVRTHHESAFEDVTHGDRLNLLFVPTFEVYRQHAALHQIIDRYADQQEIRFSWAHLHDHLHCCVVLISGAAVEITPPVLPVRDLNLFGSQVRRVYMTATLPLQTEFLRTFGGVPESHIRPGGKSGAAQRLFLFVPGTDDDAQRETAKWLIEDNKACVITPSARLGEHWCPPATRYEGKDGNAGIRAFAAAQSAQKLLLAGRFDGIDLPGDACRVLVLDGLPQAAGLLEQFFDQKLRVERLRAMHTAIRLVQGMGRIFRSNTDHGAVIVCGEHLQRWFSRPGNQKLLPPLIQQQAQLGLELRKNVDSGATTPRDLLDGILRGERAWDQLYREHVEAFETQPAEAEPDWLRHSVQRETGAFMTLWHGNPQMAAGLYQDAADEIEPEEESLAAWYRHWAGLASLLSGNSEAAGNAFSLAASVRAELGRPLAEGDAKLPGVVKPSVQAESIVRIIGTRGSKTRNMLEAIEGDLKYGDNTGPAEQALCDLGMLLGLNARRPDKEVGTGPDALWVSPETKIAVALEAKTDKLSGGMYRKKDDMGQFHDHVQWLHNELPGYQIIKVIVGRVLPVASEANPPDGLRIVPLDEFQELLHRLSKLYSAAIGLPPSDRPFVVERYLRSQGLLWPRCVDSLTGFLAMDLKTDIRTQPML